MYLAIMYICGIIMILVSHQKLRLRIMHLLTGGAYPQARTFSCGINVTF